MKTIINSKNIYVEDRIKEEVTRRLEKLDKYFTKETIAHVMFTEEGMDSKAEITIKFKKALLRSEVADLDLKIAADKAIDRIERQLIKHKEKFKKRNYESIRYDNIENEVALENPTIVKNKKFELLPMTPEEATFQLELLEHQFFVFLNAATDQVCVAYKRQDGNYGLIETEF